ncbi:MAG: helix-turn-helix transcriptional regulator [Verrucomicrobia bacterium]|nr:helix-turn-helix transcriptional regulator [Verrucomicrobiota bacterium]
MSNLPVRFKCDMRPTNDKKIYKVIIEIPGNKKRLSFVPEKHLHKLEAFLQKYGQVESLPWETLAKDRIAKYKKSGLALRGARYREGLSQKELSKRTGISQENISKMENGQRVVGEKVAKKLAKVLHIDFELLTETGNE